MTAATASGTGTRTDDVTRAAYAGSLLLNSETGRYYILANHLTHNVEALQNGDMVGRGCPCGDQMRYGQAVTTAQTEEINDRIADGEFRVEDNPGVPHLPYVHGVGGASR